MLCYCFPIIFRIKFKILITAAWVLPTGLLSIPCLFSISKFPLLGYLDISLLILAKLLVLDYQNNFLWCQYSIPICYFFRKNIFSMRNAEVLVWTKICMFHIFKIEKIENYAWIMHNFCFIFAFMHFPDILQQTKKNRKCLNFHYSLNFFFLFVFYSWFIQNINLSN